jgi:hypothetical protein
METYSASESRLLSELSALGWTVKAGLKIPHATSPSGKFRVWFKSQATYLSIGEGHTFANARSLHCDRRDLSVQALIQEIDLTNKLTW